MNFASTFTGPEDIVSPDSGPDVLSPGRDARADSVEDTGEADAQGEEDAAEGDKKKQTLACDRCRAKKRRCDGTRPICNNCSRAIQRGVKDINCTYATTMKKRGRKKGYRDALLQKLNLLEGMLQGGSGSAATAQPPVPSTSTGSGGGMSLTSMLNSHSVDRPDVGSYGNTHYPSNALSDGSSSPAKRRRLNSIDNGPAPLISSTSHPDLFRHPYGTPRRAAEFFFGRGVKGVDEVADSVEHVQVLALLGVWAYGNLEGGGRSWVYLSLAIRAAEKLELGYKRRILPQEYPFNPFPLNSSEQELPWEVAKRRRIWSFCFATDTYGAMVSGGNPGMEESDYLHVLVTTAFNGHDDLDVLGRKRSSSSITSLSSPHDPNPPYYTNTWRHILRNHPRHTIHDYSPHAWTVDPENLEHLCTHSKPWVMQCAWIMRRIKKLITGRFVTEVGRPLPPTAGAIMALFPPHPDVGSLHDMLVRWWSGIPRAERAFESFEEFRVGIPGLVPDVAQLWSFSHVVLNLFAVSAVAMLHQGNARDGRRVFLTCLPGSGGGVGGGGGVVGGGQGQPVYATSAEILLLCVRAQNYVVRSVYAAHGFSSIPFAPIADGVTSPSLSSSSSTTALRPIRTPNNPPPFSAQYPAPPACFVQSPMTCWALFATSVAFLTGAYGRVVGGEVQDVEGVTFIEGVVLPTMENCGRVWPVCFAYWEALERVLAEERGSGGQAGGSGMVVPPPPLPGYG
ncbi:hypothetical protein HDV00_009773 [Rhizophlyctis rosea]|nr:hypothetical protein HDV00_009773 [Rhizophlyctis rosea]